MTLTHILVFSAAALLGGVIFKTRGRGWFMLVLSVLAIYGLQPATPIRHLDFWLPTATLALTVLVWAATQPRSADNRRSALITGAVIAAVGLTLGLTRYIGPAGYLTPSRPPDVLSVALSVVAVGGAAMAIQRFWPNSRWLDTVLVTGLIGLFLVLKTDAMTYAASAVLRWLAGQSTDLASASDIRWLGFSYVAFRLLHSLRDRLTGKLPALSLMEFVTYVIFFPAFSAGPIDRVERFARDVRSPFKLAAPEVTAGGRRVVLGIFKKFVLADTLALVALDGANAVQTRSTFWLWILLYAYAFRLYLDFGGYTDIAIGLGRWLGVRLPENFDRPYLRPNLTQFWNSWHITLAQWFRAYFFNPLTRALRGRPLSPAVVIFITQISTMVLIGLWHGVTWNFVAWGAWHGAGLFVHNRWGTFARTRLTMLDSRPALKQMATMGSVLLTFHYVALGWVWFALPSMEVSTSVLLRLFGI